MKYSGPTIDVDVHFEYQDERELIDYLPQSWKSLVLDSNIPIRPALKNYLAQFGFRRLDVYGSDGSMHQLEGMREQLLDPHRIERAILAPGAGEVGQSNPYLASALATALNDWGVDHWYSGIDSRFYGGLVVPTQFPDAAAREIRRLGGDRRFVEVYFGDGGLGLPFGHPVYHPIYDAAAEYGLPIAIHVGVNNHVGLAQNSAGGPASNVFEWYMIVNQAAMHHLTSFVTHGVFEKWPSLMVVLLEAGINWMPWMAHQLDAEYPRFRRESPWVKRLPSEYLRQNVRLSTQPLEPPASAKVEQDWISTLNGFDDMLMFSSDYPHWDTDEADFVARYLPSSWHSKVFYENAINTYRWPAVPVGPVVASSNAG